VVTSFLILVPDFTVSPFLNGVLFRDRFSLSHYIVFLVGFGLISPLACMTLLFVFMVLGMLQMIVVIWDDK